jgi:phosphoribosyl-ATP pyrophosphohydrolase
VSPDGLVEDRFARLASAVADVRAGTRASPRTERLLSGGLSKIAKKVVEEATEVAIDALQHQRRAVIDESVDLFYNLIVVWDELGITPAEIWAEMDRRERVLGMAEKLPKDEGKD